MSKFKWKEKEADKRRAYDTPAEKGIIAQGNIINIKCLCTQQGISVEI